MNKAPIATRTIYSVPFRVSLDKALNLTVEFLAGHKGKRRLHALSGALFEVMGAHFRRFEKVNRAKLRNRQPTAADLECVNEDGAVVVAVEVKCCALKLTDVEVTLKKTRSRKIIEVFFVAPKIDNTDAAKIAARIEAAFTAGQNLYVADFFDLARAVLALGGEAARDLFLRKVGEHLDTYNTQPSHRQAWKKLLEAI